MHPALSVILFTTASGMGYGLLVLLILLGIADLLPTTRGLGLVGFGLALALITTGLLSSTFHLGHPERAWRAFSQWRTSWLSREGVVSVATYPFALLFAGAWIVGERIGGAWNWIGLLAALLAVGTVVCTGQIYATLKTIPQWHNPLTLPNYLALSFATGALALMVLALAFGVGGKLPVLLALVAVAVAWPLKHAYWTLVDRVPARFTAEQATGLGHIGTVRSLEQPHTEANYLQKEMGFEVARKHAAKLRRLVHWAGFALPLALALLCLLVPQGMATSLAVVALIAIAVGVVTERWLFFAQAQHVVMLYYGAARV